MPWHALTQLSLRSSPAPTSRRFSQVTEPADSSEKEAQNNLLCVAST